MHDAAFVPADEAQVTDLGMRDVRVRREVDLVARMVLRNDISAVGRQRS